MSGCDPRHGVTVHDLGTGEDRFICRRCGKFSEVAVLLEFAQACGERDALAAEVERLRACDCASSADGNPHHQGYCRSLSSEERRARSAEFAQSYATLSRHARDSNEMARQLADARDDAAALQRTVENWQEKWVIVDDDRCEAQQERDAALAEVERLRVAVQVQRGEDYARVGVLAAQRAAALKLCDDSSLTTSLTHWVHAHDIRRALGVDT